LVFLLIWFVDFVPLLSYFFFHLVYWLLDSLVFGWLVGWFICWSTVFFG
jgi:hypothetical protein